MGKSFWDSPSKYGTYEGERGNPAQWGSAFKYVWNQSSVAQALQGECAHNILGLPSNAGDSEIKSAYRSLAKIHHPDKGGNADTFKKISAAYYILSNNDINVQSPTPPPPPHSDNLIIPQLLTEIKLDEVEYYLNNDNFCAQEKKDGRHITLQIKDGNFFVRNKKGKASTFAPEFESSLRMIGTNIIIDGEQVGDTFWAWDILEYKDNDLRNEQYVDRYNKLVDIISTLTEIQRIHHLPSPIKIVPIVCGTDKRHLFDHLKEIGKEGIVFKNLNAIFSQGKGNDQFKYKFYGEASIIVAEGRPGKASIGMEVINESGEQIHVGYCTCVLHPLPIPGTIAEVKYLYAYRDGCLYQTSFKEIRDDVDKEECTTSQLKYKYEEL